MSIQLPFGYHGADALRFVGLLAFNILFSVQTNQYSTDYTLYGWLTLANAGLSLLLATRSNLFSIVLRLPSSVILQYHRWIGITTVAYATTHMSYTIQRYIATDQVMVSFTAMRVQVGLLAWLCLAIMFLTALPIVRRRLFEGFYYTHFLFLVFIGGAYYHSTSGPYATEGIEFLTIGLGLWAIDRIVRFAFNFRKIDVQSVTYYEGDLVKFKCSGMGSASPGQIVWIQIPSVSLVNWHPFTVASSVDASPVTTIAIRGLGGFTAAVQSLPEAKSSTSDKPLRLRFDGPYGVGRFNWETQRLAVLVAGGVGITPGLSIASRSIRCATSGHVHLLWVVKDKKHISWFADELRELHELSTSGSTTFTVQIHVSGGDAVAEKQGASPDTTERPWTVQAGRPNLYSWLQDIKQRRPGLDAAVNICGPRSLIRDARRACVRASNWDGLLYVEEEVFEL